MERTDSHFRTVVQELAQRAQYRRCADYIDRFKMVSSRNPIIIRGSLFLKTIQSPKSNHKMSERRLKDVFKMSYDPILDLVLSGFLLSTQRIIFGRLKINTDKSVIIEEKAN